MQKYYTVDLAHRLLEKTFISKELEKNMLTRFKTEQGVSFTSIMERMFKDITLSGDIEAEFVAWYKQTQQPQKQINSR